MQWLYCHDWGLNKYVTRIPQHHNGCNVISLFLLKLGEITSIADFMPIPPELGFWNLVFEARFHLFKAQVHTEISEGSS